MDGSIDYAEVGLRVGLEVHQQLLTEQKMFCKCPAGLFTESASREQRLHLRDGRFTPVSRQSESLGYRHRTVLDVGL